MPFTTKVLIKEAADQPFKVGTAELPDLKPEQVCIDVKYCGVCHSDLAMGENHWGMTQYPFVGGHEIAGVVSQVGDQVKHLKVGDRVGAGWFSGSCQDCNMCSKGQENFCGSQERTIVGRHGGFANKVLVNKEWCIKVPDEMNLEDAGPLFCAGATVFTPIYEHVHPTHTVGVISVGGLGHLAIQFAAKWGCKVVAFTSAEDKKKMALELGASEVIDSKDSEAIKKAAGTIDMLLMCGTGDLDWDAYIATLAPKGTIHFCGVPPSPVTLQLFPILLNNSSVTSGPVSSPNITREMVNFAARHSIKPVSQVFEFSKVGEAFDHLKAGKARLRIVLKNDLEADA